MSSNRTVFAEEVPFSTLVSKARAGDQDAFAALYEATSKDVYCAVRAMVRTEEMAMDIQQDTYVFAFTHLDQLGDPDKFRAWVHSIAVNRTRSLLRKQTAVLFSELESEEDPVPEIADYSTETSPELSLDRKETARLVREILEELSDGQRMLIGLYYYDQMPVGKIAEAMEVTPGTVKKQLSRARKKIEAAVKRLEANGTKLYGLSPMPFLLALLRGQAPAARAERAVLTGTLSKAGVTAKAVAVHLGRPFFETALGRVVLGSLAAAVVGGGVVGYNWFQARATYGPDQVPETVDTAEDLTTEPTTDPIPTQPETAEDIITEPETSEPVTTEAVTEPETTEPAVAEPAPTEPKPTDPEPTEPAPTEPKPTDPEPETTDQEATEPTPTEPETTESELMETQPAEPEDLPEDTTEPKDNSGLPTTLPCPPSPGTVTIALGETWSYTGTGAPGASLTFFVRRKATDGSTREYARDIGYQSNGEAIIQFYPTLPGEYEITYALYDHSTYASNEGTVSFHWATVIVTGG